MSFLSEYFGLSEGATEHAICCPFPHSVNNGDITYLESNPSAHINVSKGLFHCKACGKGYNEIQFIQEVLGCSIIDASYLQMCFKNTEDELEWSTTLTLAEEKQTFLTELGINTQTINLLQIKSDPSNSKHICFPVFMYGHLVDIRTYKPGEKPKWKSRIGARTGLIVPFDIWRESDIKRNTLVCAGEKDMAVARAYGFNAITLTGGENVLPFSYKEFADRNVIIAYDNDEAGLRGAINLANNLLGKCKSVKIVTGFHEICKEKGEDITDFFIKYQKTRQDLITYIEATPDHVFTPLKKDKTIPTVDLRTAASPKHINKTVRSNIQVVASSDQAFACCSSAYTEYEGQVRVWELTDETTHDLPELIDSNFTEEKIHKNLKRLLRIPADKKGIRIKTVNKVTVFKVFVTDLFETSDKDIQPMEFLAYAVNIKLESGKKYLVTHKLVPHPYKGQQLIMIITDAETANDSVSNFKLSNDIKTQLKLFQEVPGTVSEKVKYFSDRVKGILGYNGNNQLIQTIDLAFHTPLQFNFGNFQNVRGYLDTLIVSESRLGKSSTAEALRKTYGLGTFASLAGNSATIAGLIGGSNKTSSGSFQTRAGIIPQNHKGLVIFEEFGKSSSNIIAELTDIRSSNEVRIARVSGTLTLPALVRMITLTNTKPSNGVTRAINAYPNGIAVVTELVPTIEDIARYDLVLVLGDRGTSQIDPFWTPQTPFETEAYRARIRWVWSRTAEQILITDEVAARILEQANELNKNYDCHIKIFGTEAWKKLARLSIAVAGYLVSTDESHENIVVTREHVDFAADFLIALYDNETFKLKEFVNLERKYTTIDAEGVAVLQDLYTKTPSLLLQLEQNAVLNKNILMASTGMETADLNRMLNRLTQQLFIRFQNHDILPTERFRKGMRQIQRNVHVARLGGDY